MNYKDYSNFVRSSCDENTKLHHSVPRISGQEARKLYLEEVLNDSENVSNRSDKQKPGEGNVKDTSRKRQLNVEITDKELLQGVQNNNIKLVKNALDTYPDKINLLDEFGWNLLMIACQANSVETVKELLKRGIDTSVRDKAGNSAASLVIKNKNIFLANILLNHNSTQIDTISELKQKKVKLKEEYKCEICGNVTYPDRLEHLSSTVHNINASKGKKPPTKYVIPESNKGYQIMLKEGWNKETGLGPEGLGNKYPIKPVIKKDRKGLGLKQKEVKCSTKNPKLINKEVLRKEQYNNKVLEIKFRREFY